MLSTIGIVFPPSPEALTRMENARFAKEERREDAKRGGPVHVDGYTRKDGTYVKPYTRSAPTNGKGK